MQMKRKEQIAYILCSNTQRKAIIPDLVGEKKKKKKKAQFHIFNPSGN